MKHLHRDDLFSWTLFDEARNVDFHGTYWSAHGGVLVDPLPLSAHDRAHIDLLGGVGTIVVTNSDHARSAVELSKSFGAVLCGPKAERDTLGWADARWIGDGDEVVPGLMALVLNGSKTPGELALVLDETTLITGDLVRGQHGGRLNRLPDAKLADVAAAELSIRRLSELPEIDAVIVGDGWPVFSGGRGALQKLAAGILRHADTSSSG
ncbi:MAG: hypothetical protein ACI9KE_004875 [Polyangiales bacterium]|jgi:hypothetical protein